MTSIDATSTVALFIGCHRIDCLSRTAFHRRKPIPRPRPLLNGEQEARRTR